MTLAAKVIADGTFHAFVFAAFILFFVAFVLALVERSVLMALLCAGLICVAAAYVVVS